MPTAHPTPILNASLPLHFRQIRLELAREPGHPDGDSDVAYVILAPLDADGRIDAALWKDHREACRVTRLRSGEDDRHGQLVHRRGGSWAFHYDTATRLADDVGYHFADERFVVGEYVSIDEGGEMHTYRVASVSRL